MHRLSGYVFSGLLMILLFSASCANRTPSEPQAVASEIVDLWDNGQARKVWLYANVDGVRTVVKEIQYHPNGVKSMEGPLKDGLRHGEWKSWYEDGNLWSVGSFVNGLRHGKGIVYHPNGKKFIEGAYLNGERVGKWYWWDEEGRSITELEALKIAPELVE
ncbi:MAG: hypothetical protein IPM52_07555 [Bacteroidetes bacterium]|nr:hypothetical protein [Bacteroidota bacterium]